MNPPFSITPIILNEISQIERLIGRIDSLNQPKPHPQLRKSNRVRTVQGSLAIEGNTLNLEQITAIIDGKTVIGKKEEIREVINAIEVYDSMQSFNPFAIRDFLKAHKTMMDGLVETAGKWRKGNVGIMKGTKVSHIAPQANQLHPLMTDVFQFLKNDEHNLLIRGCVFHYELEFIHPFEDGNGRMGRFWHSLLLSNYHPVFEFIPVESLIRDNQRKYYAALEKSDKNGNSTNFLEFSLSMIHQALANFIDDIKPRPLTSEMRLEIAKSHFTNDEFPRKKYLDFFKTISTATASRDLKLGIDKKLLLKKGTLAQTIYQFTDAN